MQRGRIAKPGPGHIDHERAVPMRGFFEQSRPQRLGVGDVDLLGCGHHRHAPDHGNRKLIVGHLRTSCGCGRRCVCRAWLAQGLTASPGPGRESSPEVLAVAAPVLPRARPGRGTTRISFPEVVCQYKTREKLHVIYLATVLSRV